MIFFEMSEAELAEAELARAALDKAEMAVDVLDKAEMAENVLDNAEMAENVLDNAEMAEVELASLAYVTLFAKLLLAKFCKVFAESQYQSPFLLDMSHWKSK